MTHPSSQADGLSAGLHALGLTLTAAQQTQLLDYMALIQKWTKVYNLTAVRDPAEMLTHHLLDSLAIIAPLRHHTQNVPQRLLDVGAGAGLPGVVVAICCPEIQVTCVDTVAKKAAFIQQAAGTLKLPNLRGLHARVENLAAAGEAAFDIITSRAFASLADFCAWSGSSLKEGGAWMAMKGKLPTDEIAVLPPNVTVFHVEHLQVPGLDAQRCLVWLWSR
jgi:16S rRNA (guanine527-N7)-methyltransferase